MPDRQLSQVESAAYVQAAVDAAPRVLLVIDAAGVIQWASRSTETLVGLRADEVAGRNILEFVVPDDVALVLESMEYVLEQTGDFRPMEFRFHRADGSIGVLEAVSANRLADPTIHGIVVQVHDVTHRRILDQALEAIAAGVSFTAILRLIARLVEELLGEARVVVGVDPVGDSFGLAASTLDIVDQLSGVDLMPATTLEPDAPDGPDADEAAPVTFGEPDADPDRPVTPWGRAIRSGNVVIEADLASMPPWLQDEARLQGFAGCWVFPVALPSNDRIEGCLIAWRTVTGAPSPGQRVGAERAGRLLALALERRRSQDLLLHAARHDTLTGLPNRSQFFARLAHELHRNEHLVAVLYLDLDSFKPVNDRYGHRAGDQVLVTVAQRIEDMLRPDDLTGRLGGDEFGVICSRLHDPAEAVAIAERLIEAIARPVWLPPESIRSPEMAALAGAPFVADVLPDEPVEVRVGASIGIAFGPEAGTDHERLVELADAAMYQAKHAGRGCWRLSTDVPTSSQGEFF